MFTGTPVVKQVADGLVRITGVSLVDGESGTIGLFEKTVAPDVRLPQAFMPRDYSRPDGDVSLQDCVEVSFVVASPLVNSPIPVSVVKTGTTPADFLVTMKSLTESSETSSSELEIYVRYH